MRKFITSDITVFKNYRVYDTENDLEFMTEEKCEYCGCQVESYIKLKPYFDNGFPKMQLICKGCLSEFINMLNEDFQEMMKNSKRG